MKKIKKTLHHLFVPHLGNNHRSKLLHHSSLLIILLAIIALIASSTIINTKRPDILGISYSISEHELLTKTNEVRAQNGLPPLSLNARLSQAAAGKARHMFINNYWAHFGPDGATPWQFINGAGYEYVYAGENLAKGFTQSGDIVNAWMNSPSHRENLLSPKYNDIGFAVVEGQLLGEDTVLVVQMFGAPQSTLAQASQPEIPQQAQTPQIEARPEAALQEETVVPQGQQVEPVSSLETVELTNTIIEASPTLSADFLSQSITLSVFTVILFALLIDIVIVGKKKIPRLVGNNMDHILIVTIFIMLVIVQSRGGIL